MNYSIDEIENDILKSPLFSLDRETQYTSYKKESLKMVGYLYSYLMARNKKEYEGYGLEITEVSKRCIKNFDGEKGEFLHYFNRAWKMEFLRISMKASEEKKYRGVHISENDRRNLRKIIKLLNARCVEIDSPDVIEILAENTSFDKEEIKAMIDLYKIEVKSNCEKNNEGEEYQLIELLKTTESTEEKLIYGEELTESLNYMERVYFSLQERQRKIFSDVFTAKICECIVGEKIYYDKYEFINREMVDEYIKNNYIPSQRQIAQLHGRDEASLSRTVKEFIKKLDKIKEI